PRWWTCSAPTTPRAPRRFTSTPKRCPSRSSTTRKGWRRKWSCRKSRANGRCKPAGESGEVSPAGLHRPFASTNNLLAPLDVVPDHIAIQIAARGEDHPAFCRLGHPICELHVFLRLIPVRDQEDVNGDAVARTEQR